MLSAVYNSTISLQEVKRHFDVSDKKSLLQAMSQICKKGKILPAGAANGT